MEKKDYTVYCLICPTTGLIRYVGVTGRSFEQRYSEHLKDASKTHRGCWLRSILAKDLKPQFHIIDIVPNSEWQFWEQHYISLFKSWGFSLVNSTFGGEGTLGSKRTDKERKKISETRKQFYLTNPDRRYDLTRSLTPEQRRAAIARLRTIKMTPAGKQKISQIHKGKKLPKEACAAIAERFSKKIFQFTREGVLIRKWESQSEIMRSLGFNQAAISRASSKNRFAYGYLWSESEMVTVPDIKFRLHKR